MRQLRLKDLLDKEIKKILADEKVQAILIVGSAVDQHKEVYNDIDIFVITWDSKGFEREVIEKENVQFDISYISIDLLKMGLREKWPFLINGLLKYEILYNESDEIEDLLNQIYSIHRRGPGVLEKEKIRYIRFKLYQGYEDLINRKGDLVNFTFLSHQLLKEILIAYFKLNNMWIPKEKKILQILSGRDLELYTLCSSFILENGVNNRIKLIEEILEHILMPFGGLLKSWKKGAFPLK